MMRLLLAFLATTAPLYLIPIQPPGEEVEPLHQVDVLAPLADLANISPPERIHIRYLWLGSLGNGQRKVLIAALRGHIPALATESDLIPPTVVGDGLYLRVDAHAQGELFLKVWERLANFDPYFHFNAIDLVTETRITVVQIGGNRVKFRCMLPRDGAVVTIQGQPTEKRAGLEREFESPPIEKESVWDFAVDGSSTRVTARPGQLVTLDFRGALGSGKTRRQLVPWLEPLAKAVQSEAPLLDGGWFLSHTAIQEGKGNAGYYDFLGIKNRGEFEKLIGFNGKLAEGARFTEFLEAVADSRVAQQPRRVQREYALGGGYWRTADNKLADAERNPLRILDRKLFKHAAEEAIGFKSNGWFVSGLFVGNQPLNAAEKDGDRQNSAPDFIGYTPAHGLDGRIHAGMGCIACHYYLDAGGDRGLIDFDPWVRDTFKPGAENPFTLPPTYDADQDRKLRQQYLRPFTGPMESDRARHAAAVKEATGLTAKEWGQAYVNAYNAYEAPFDLARAARYWGMDQEVLKAKAIEAARAGKLDPVIAGLVRGKKVGARQFEEIYPLGLLLKGQK